VVGTFLRLLGRGVRDLAQRPWTQAMTLGAVVLTAFLAGLFLMLLNNLDREVTARRGGLSFQVYWRTNADMDAVRAKWKKLAELPKLVEIETFTPQEALEKLTRAMRADVDANALEGGAAVLPPTAVLHFEAPGHDPDAWAKDMLSRLQGIEDVESVHFNALAVEATRSWLSFTRRVIWPLIGLLAVVMALAVGNTIRLSLYSRKQEIEILKLVGAGRWYVRTPLLVSAAAQGLTGAGLALGLLKLLQLAVRDLLAGPPMFLEVVYIPAWQALMILGAVTLVSLTAALVAARG
jgi:cell division transport system permease protein